MGGARTGWLPLLARGRSLERGSGEALRFFQHRFWATGCEALWLAVRENRRPRLDVVGLQSCRIGVRSHPPSTSTNASAWAEAKSAASRRARSCCALGKQRSQTKPCSLILCKLVLAHGRELIALKVGARECTRDVIDPQLVAFYGVPANEEIEFA